MKFHILKNFINKKIIELNITVIFCLYLTFILFISLMSVFYAYLINIEHQIADSNNNIIIERLQFSYAGLVNNLVNNWEYSSVLYGVKHYLSRLPILPVILSLAIKINSNIYFIYIFKNFIFFSIYFLSSFLYCKHNQKKLKFFLIVVMFSFIIPYNFHVGMSILFADSIIYLILPSLYLILNSNISYKYYLISFYLIILYLTKTSMTYIVLIIPFIILLIEKDTIRNKMIPLLSVIIVVIGWGSFGLIKTGKFPFLQSTLTINSSAFFFVNCNSKFNEFYPYKSIDLLLPNNIDFSKYSNEWEVHDEYKNKIKSSKCFDKNLIQQLSKKINFIFFNINKDSVWPDKNGNFNNPIIYSFVFNKLFFILAITIATSKIILNIFKYKKIERYKLEIYFLSIVTLNLFPHLVAWATAKHLVPIQLISFIYLLILFKNFKRSYSV